MGRGCHLKSKPDYLKFNFKKVQREASDKLRESTFCYNLVKLKALFLSKTGHGESAKGVPDRPRSAQFLNFCIDNNRKRRIFATCREDTQAIDANGNANCLRMQESSDSRQQVKQFKWK